MGDGLAAWFRFHGTNSISPSEFAYGAFVSAQKPRYPPVREGMERALTRRNESPACKLFPTIRRCSLPVIVPARRVPDFHGTNSLRSSELAYGASLSAQQPHFPAVREGMERALTRRKGSPACKLFPTIRGCSLPVIVPARRVADSHGTNFLASSEFAYGASLSAQQPRYPAVRKGMERALTRRKGSSACELFPAIRGCSLPVIVPARRVPDSRGTG